MPAPLVEQKLEAAELGKKPRRDSFQAADLVITRTTSPKTKEEPEDLLFGKSFTDHMLVIEHTQEGGWGTPHIKPFGPLKVHPASPGLQYGVSCFEGMKSYMSENDGPRLFRPDRNMARLRSSAARLLLADFDPDELLKCLKALLQVDRDWYIKQDGYSIYMRPFIYGSACSLGIYPTDKTTLSVILSPVGPYFRAGFKPVRLFVDEEHVRAWPGGAGARKIAGNYAPTLRPQAAAFQKHGCAQVLYTRPTSSNPADSVVSECGALNIFFLFKQEGAAGGKELVTPPLDDTILPGVTRDSLLQLATELGECLVSDRHVTLVELKKVFEEGRLLEVFGCGTACCVQPISALLRANGDTYSVPEGNLTEHSLTARLTKKLLDIQYYRTPHEWSVPIDE